MESYGGKGVASNKNFASTGRAVMQKKFKINDGANTFVEQNTLLEPANNAAAQQHDQEEINEVSMQLQQIKKSSSSRKQQPCRPSLEDFIRFQALLAQAQNPPKK